MKKIISLMILMFAFLGLQAQTAAKPLKVSGSQLLNYQAAQADTVNKDVTKWFYFYTDNVIIDSKVQAYIATGRTYATNKPKVKIYQQSSLDNVNWVHLDSATSINGAGLYGVTAKVAPYAKYYRIGVKGIDSTQTTTFRLNAIFVQP
jgi:hypothetical protein